MTELVELPGPRDGDDNVTSTRYLQSDEQYTVPEQTYVYASLYRLFFGDHNSVASFVNNGTIWDISSVDGASAVAGWDIRSLVNNGLMVAEGRSVSSVGIFLQRGAQLINNGSIYAISDGQALGISHNGQGSDLIDNSGIIAAYSSGTGTNDVPCAYGLYIGGTSVINRATGSILAEGSDAVAVHWNRGSLFGASRFVNDGRIEALSSFADQLSYAFRAGGAAPEYLFMTNNGVIRADVAWSSSIGEGMDQLTNSSTGQIYGRIETGGGEDFLNNEGLLIGDVSMGDEDDTFWSAGTFIGVVDMGWHDDQYFGSAGDDVVTGNRGDDILSGNGGNDLILGGTGHDILYGNAGNDSLYGELGNDWIETQGGDRAYGGDGDDTIALSDLAFAYLSGGAGLDRLVFNIDGMKLNLHSAILSGRLGDFERLFLHNGQQVAVSAGDATAMAGGQLEFLAQASEKVTLVGAWAEGAIVARNGTLFRSFSLGSETVFVQTGASVAISSSVPTGFSGLSPIPSGGSAPLAGTVPGGDFANPVQEFSVTYSMNRDIRIDEGETWRSTGGMLIRGNYSTTTLENHGTMETNDGAWVLNGYIGLVENDGLIRSTAGNNGYASAIDLRGNLVNSGVIEATGGNGRVVAVEMGSLSSYLPAVQNAGTIAAHATNGVAIGVQIEQNGVVGPILVNSGTIEAVGGAGTTGAAVQLPNLVINEGTIVASNWAGSGANDAIALHLSSGPSLGTVNAVENSGVIRGPIAILADGMNEDIINTGSIEGRVQLGAGSSLVFNEGSITGPVTLGGGTNAYLGENATRAVAVTGGDGADLLVGGSFADSFSAGDGNDLLIGGGGADTLTGGAGADRFLYRAVSDSTGLNVDLIQDFQTGVDRLDLSLISPTSVALSSSGGVTTVTATAVGGTMVIRVAGTIAASDIDWSRPTIQYGSAAGEAMIGSAASRDLRGGGGGDILVGTSGNDRLDGGTGLDVLIGGGGNDTYVVDDPLDLVIERDGGGVDLILTRHDYILPAFVENVTNLGAAGVRGNALDNVMTGSSGNDGFDGLDGDDVMIGGLGADIMSGGNGFDRFVYNSAADSVAGSSDFIKTFECGIDKIDLSALVVSSISWVNVRTQFDNYEEVTVQTDQGVMIIKVGLIPGGEVGLSLNDFIVRDLGVVVDGGPGDDLLNGTAYNDTLRGYAGNDTLNGGAGADQMLGGLGDDIYVVDNAGDVVTELAGQGADEVRTALAYTLGANIENLRLSGTGAVSGTGNALDNTIRGNEAGNALSGMDGADLLYGNGGNDVLDGGAGDDKLFGGDGDDTLTGGAGLDRLYGGLGDDRYIVTDDQDFAYENAGEGYDQVFSSIDLQLRDNVEMLTLTGTAAIGKGNALDNLIVGTDGGNRLYGYDGDDRLEGNGGDDYLVGGAGNDVLVAGSGYDRLFGGTGDDVYYATDRTTYVYENAGEGNDRVVSSVTMVLRPNVEELVLTGTDALRGYGNELSNQVIGNDGANQLYGYGGADHLAGGGGNDVLDGGEGGDLIEGGAGTDRFYGGAGADTFLFRDGDFGGLSSSTADRIHDFSQAEGDRIRLDLVDANVNLAGDQAFSFIGSSAFHGIAGELRAVQQSGVTYVMGDTNGDGQADFWIRLDGLHTLSNNDFVL